jgi:hypothetical protein
VLTQNCLLTKLLAVAVLTATISAVWLVAVFKSPASITEWFQLTLELFAYSACSGSVAAALIKLKFDSTLAFAFAVILGLAWLTWPIWLSSTLVESGAQSTTSLLVKLHPPLVANGVLEYESPWTEKTLAYSLTNLNQDLPIQLPSSAWVSILAHGAIAVGLFAISRLSTSWGNSSGGVSRPSPSRASP